MCEQWVAAATLSSKPGLLRLRALFLAITGFDTSAYAGQHLLGRLSKWTSRLQLEILIESVGRPLWCNHLIALQSGLSNHVHTQPIIGIGPIRIGGNGFLEGFDRVVHFAGVGQ